MLPQWLIGKPFGCALANGQAGVVVGVENSKAGLLCPDFSRPFDDSDRLIVLAKDLESAQACLPLDPDSWNGAVDWPTDPVDRSRVLGDAPGEVTLLIGWTSGAQRIIDEVRNHGRPGSEVHVLVDRSWTAPKSRPAAIPVVHNLPLTVHYGSSTSKADLTRILTVAKPDHVLVLCDERDCSATTSDARTLMTLLHLNAIFDHAPPLLPQGPNVVAEILLLDSVSLGRLAGPDDFIVSQHLVSLTIAQLSEYRKRKWVFDALLLRGDAEVTLHPCETYGIGSAVTFEELVDRGRQRGIIVIGWQTSEGVRRTGSAQHGTWSQPFPGPGRAT